MARRTATESAGAPPRPSGSPARRAPAPAAPRRRLRAPARAARPPCGDSRPRANRQRAIARGGGYREVEATRPGDPRHDQPVATFTAVLRPTAGGVAPATRGMPSPPQSTIVALGPDARAQPIARRQPYRRPAGGRVLDGPRRNGTVEGSEARQRVGTSRNAPRARRRRIGGSDRGELAGHRRIDHGRAPSPPRPGRDHRRNRSRDNPTTRGTAAARLEPGDLARGARPGRGAIQREDPQPAAPSAT